MKYVKENLDVVICLGIALIALVLCFWPTRSWGADLQSRMTDRLQQRSVASGLVGPVEIIPGGPKLDRATIEPNVIAAKEGANKAMKQQAVSVAKLAAEQNQQHRVKVVPGTTGGPGKPGTPDKYIPLLANDLQEDNYLPTLVPTRADPMGFKDHYQKQFTGWLTKLVGAPNMPATPPSQTEVTAQLDAKRNELMINERATRNLMGGGNAANTLSIKETNLIKKAAVLNRAAKIRCYVDENALQKREWFGRSVPPTEPQIFEALVDTWLQQDVVNAIAALNDEVLQKQPSEAKNVGHAPIKRVEAIVIGAAAQGSGSSGAPGWLFMNQPTGGQNPAGPAPMATASPAGIDYSRSVTGHVGTPEYDVVPLKVVIYIDPAYENAFIDTLYRQNNGYTLINRSMRAVDPLEASSNGFLYGKVQVIRLELTFESLMFRSWTVPLMPNDIRTKLGIPPVGTPAPGGFR